MATFEHWAEAYLRIANEVREEHPDWDSLERFVEYKKRFEAWKRERGIR